MSDNPNTLRAVLAVRIEGFDGAVQVRERASGEQAYALVRADDASPVDDERLLRDALALVAVCETLTEPLEPAALREIVMALVAWRERAASEAGDASPRERAQLDTQIGAAIDAFVALELAVGDEPQTASVERLEAVSQAQIALEAAFAALEDAADAWSDLVHETHHELVVDLWQTMGNARSGPLAQTASQRVEMGRRAGAALAADVLSQ